MTGPWIPNPLDSFASCRPGHPALVSSDFGREGEGRCWTARQWRDEVATLASGIASGRGVEAGHRVCLVADSSPRFLAALQAVWWLNAIPVVVSEGRRGVGVELSDVELPLTDLHINGPGELNADSEGSAPSFPADWNLAATRLVLLTSGSTGSPKPVELTGTQLLFSAYGSATRLGHQVDDVWLCCLPLNHIGGLAVHWRTTLLQTTTHLLPRFEASEVLALIDSGAITMLSVVPDMLRRLVQERAKHPATATEALRVVLVGGERCPQSLADAAKASGFPVALTWGMSETASQVATRFVGDTESSAHAGPPLPLARVIAEAGCPLVVRGPIARPPAPPLGDGIGHHRTSDHGFVDSAGRVHVTGRADSIFISGGENIAPSEVERVLMDYPGIEDAAVVAVSDPRWGARPAAWVVAGSGSADPSPDDLRAHCRGHLERYQIPVRLLVSNRDRFPRTAAGKADRVTIARTLEEMPQ